MRRDTRIPATSIIRDRQSLPASGLTLLETVIALALIGLLLSILLPALASARISSHRDQCMGNLRQIGEAWETYLGEHNREFPYVPVQPAWHYGGMRLSGVDRSAFPDYNRPLTAYLNLFRTRHYADLCVCCPADRGISAVAAAAGTGERTAFESFGTSYRANAPLMDASMLGLTRGEGDRPGASRGMRRSEITAAPSRLLLCGDAVWYEAAESTGRHADWHGEPNAGNILLLDGSVRFMSIRPRQQVGAMVFDPILPANRLPAATMPR